MDQRNSGRHVLVINHFAVPRGHPGGTRHVELFSKMRGWSYTIIASRTNLITNRRQKAAENFRFVPVTPYRSNGIGRVINWCSYFASATIAGLRPGRVDVVYASTPHLLAGLSGLLIAKVRRIPLVLEVRDLWPRVLVDMGQLSEKSALYKVLAGLEALLYRHARTIVILAAGVRPEIEASGISPTSIVHIPNAADPNDFNASDTRAALREKFGFTKTVVIYAGAHGPANGLDLVVDAADKFRDDPVEFVLVGSGVEKERLRERVAELGLDSTVRFMDAVSKAAIPDLLTAADVGLHCLADVPLFRYGVSPNKIYDYMAAGLPMVTNTPGEVSDLVTQAGAGCAVAPGDLASGIRELTSATAEMREVIGSNGRNWLLNGHSRTSAAHDLHQLLESTTARRR